MKLLLDILVILEEQRDKHAIKDHPTSSSSKVNRLLLPHHQVNIKKKVCVPNDSGILIPSEYEHEFISIYYPGECCECFSLYYCYYEQEDSSDRRQWKDG